MGIYQTAVSKANSGTPLSPIEYASFILGATTPAEVEQQVTLDNSASVWDPAQKNGNSLLTFSRSSNTTVYFLHANYVGAESSSPISALELPPMVLSRWAAVTGETVESFAGWTLIIAGAALIGLVVASAFFPELLPLDIAAATLFYLGVGLVVAGAVIAAITPTISGRTCNSAGTGCCFTSTSAFGQTETCTNCSGTSCTTTTQPTGPTPLNLLGSLALGILAISAVGIGSYAAYKYVSNRPPRPYSPPASSQRPLSERSGLLPSTYRTVRRTTGQAYQRTKNYLIGS